MLTNRYKTHGQSDDNRSKSYIEILPKGRWEDRSMDRYVGILVDR